MIQAQAEPWQPGKDTSGTKDTRHDSSNHN